MQQSERKKLLLVDDMDVILDVIIVHLNQFKLDFEYVRASNGRDACKLALVEQPDLILMDWEMPVMNGIDALGILKRNARTKDIPVVMLSGFTESDNVKVALEIGAVDYIRKPIDSVELVARVRSVLALHSAFDALKKKSQELVIEKEKVEKILRGVIPSQVLSEIRDSGQIKPKRYRHASVMFADLVGFTQKTNKMSPKRLVDELNDIFSAFDRIVVNNNCTRIKTIGDAYLAVSGLPIENDQHAINLVNAAIEFRRFIAQRNKIKSIKWDLTIGVNSGSIIGSLIGHENFLFDIFGDSVNVAARLQGQCLPMRIAISESTYYSVYKHFNCNLKGNVEMKGVGSMNVYNIIDDYKQSQIDLINSAYNNVPFDIF